MKAANRLPETKKVAKATAPSDRAKAPAKGLAGAAAPERFFRCIVCGEMVDGTKYESFAPHHAHLIKAYSNPAKPSLEKLAKEDGRE